MPIIGIDLGTTSSRVAIYQNGAPTIVKDIHGDGTIPSYVALTEDNKFIVGEAARRYATHHPSRVIFSAKRLLGLTYGNPIVEEFKNMVPFSIVSGDGDMAWFEIEGNKLSPVTICSLVFHRLRCVAERYLGEDCNQCILTIPADFNELQRLLMIQAASDAGLEVLRTLSEPTAASLNTKISEDLSTFAVYDLGGGTFDITIFEGADGVYEVKDSRSDLFLGGEDFDFAIAERLLDRVNAEFEFDIASDAVARARLKNAAENAKISLSFETRARVDLPFLAYRNGKSFHFATTITREDIEADIVHLIDRTLEVCEASLAHAECSKGSINKVILVGGSTRIPLVARKVSDFFEMEPEGRARREDAVALGAAIQSGVFDGNLKDTLLLDAMHVALGVGDKRGNFFSAVTKGTVIPTKKSIILKIPESNKNGMKIDILEESGSSDKKRNKLGHLDILIDDFSKRKKVEITFDINANQKVLVSSIITPGNIEGPSWNSNDLVMKGVRSDFCVQYPDHFDSDFDDFIDRGNIRVRRELSEENREKSVRLESAKRKPKIFLCYARDDVKWLKTVHLGLGILERMDRVNFWYDDHMKIGEEYRDEIFQEIEKSWMAILILTPSFFASDFVMNQEIPRIFSEHEERGLNIVPLVARPCAYALHDDIEKLQAAHDPKEPLAVLPDGKVDEVLVKVAMKINEMLD